MRRTLSLVLTGLCVLGAVAPAALAQQPVQVTTTRIGSNSMRSMDGAAAWGLW